MLGLLSGWGAAAELGVGALVLIALAWQSPKIIDSCGRFTKIILKHRVEMKRIPEKVKGKKANLARKIESKTKGKDQGKKA